MVTTKQRTANRANARQSTGPKTDEGKRAVSGNRITHGILSNRLLLNDELLEDYQALLDGLVVGLKPEGTLELVLVEKIAVALWRQRRLVAAETGATVLAANAERELSEVCVGLGLPDYGGQALRAVSMEEPDSAQQDWCQKVISEYEAAAILEQGELEEECPLIYQQLVQDAGCEKDIPSYIDGHSEHGLLGYVQGLIKWCRRQIQDAGRYPEVQALTTLAKAKLGIPWGSLELLSKYQASLDNQLYKAMKALREVQEWRLETAALTGEVVDDGDC
jgi:hypothetical protein